MFGTFTIEQLNPERKDLILPYVLFCLGRVKVVGGETKRPRAVLQNPAARMSALCILSSVLVVLYLILRDGLETSFSCYYFW